MDFGATVISDSIEFFPGVPHGFRRHRDLGLDYGVWRPVRRHLGVHGVLPARDRSVAGRPADADPPLRTLGRHGDVVIYFLWAFDS